MNTPLGWAPNSTTVSRVLTTLQISGTKETGTEAAGTDIGVREPEWRAARVER